MGVSWSGSARRASLPPDWETRIRPAVLARDGHRCQWPIGAAICAAAANQVDHKTPHHLGGTDDFDNLWAICPPHHSFKSSQEGGRAFGAIRTRMAAARWRKPEPHPGLITKETG